MVEPHNLLQYKQEFTTALRHS